MSKSEAPATMHCLTVGVTRCFAIRHSSFIRHSSLVIHHLATMVGGKLCNVGLGLLSVGEATRVAIQVAGDDTIYPALTLILPRVRGRGGDTAMRISQPKVVRNRSSRSVEKPSSRPLSSAETLG